MQNYDKPEILIIEDDPNDADLILRTFKKINLANKLVHLWDGAEALDFLFARNAFAYRDVTDLPGVILLDIKMPRIDGIEVLRQLKEHPLFKSIPIVILTSSKDESDIVKSYGIGTNSFVVKPVEFENFAKVIIDAGMYWLLINQTSIAKTTQL